MFFFLKNNPDKLTATGASFLNSTEKASGSIQLFSITTSPALRVTGGGVL